ncbi:hypothetical protein [uncultured Acetobacteroides sp.]|uniref:hypothetical protein n=1 Tax=uncultured Acetobacteroides sp. TaxID=1760811 RepID=UPI0029F4F85E|nr:hypothetical protein [uncultured Acetobacteroides sp.]
MKEKKSLSALLGRTRSTINTITINPEIRTELKKYGYTDERLDWGTTKLTAIESFFEKQKKEQGEAYAASKQYLEQRAHVEEFYRKDIKLLRIPARSNPELDKLLPKQVQTDNANQLVKDSMEVYQNLINNPNLAAALLLVGRKPTDYADKLAEVKQLGLLVAQYEKEFAEAVTATSNRDKEFDELQAYCRDLRTIAGLALEGKPALKRLVDEL